MTRRKKNILWLLFFFTLATSMIVAYYELKYVDVLIAFMKLKNTKAKIVKVSRKSLIFMTDSDDDDVFFEEMDRLGWTYYQRYGRGYLFSKEGEEILATKTKHFTRYSVYEVHNGDYFEYLSSN